MTTDIDNIELYNTDSIKFWKMLDNFRYNDEISGAFRKLSYQELNNLFRNSNFIRKVVTKYPTKASLIGYNILDKNGLIIESNNSILIKAFKESSIRARIYGKCICELKFTTTPDKQLKKTDKLIGYRIHNEAHVVGDFYEVNISYQYKVHKSRILCFYGALNYQYNIDESDYILNNDYSDSIIQGLYNSFTDYLESNTAGKYILKNLSYLLIGIENLGNMSKSDVGKQMVYNRLTDLNENRNIGRVIAFDKKYEEIQFISQTISGFTDVVNELKNFLTSETEYPAEELFDKAPNQSLGSGIQNQLIARQLWATRCTEWVIENWLDNYISYYSNFYNMSEYKIDIPLMIETSDKDDVELQKLSAERDKILFDIGAITPEEVRDAYKGNTFSVNLNVDSDPIPDNSYWDTLANISIQDLDILAEETIND